MWGKNQANSDELKSDIPIYEQDMLRSAAVKGRQLHVGIVGAGFAGLRCADVLLQHGHKVTIFEARSRVGGRVGQSNHLGHLVDLGPNWIHGTDNNPIMTIAKQTHTQLHDWDENQQLFDTDGKPLAPDIAAEYGSLIWDDGLIASAFEYSRKNTATIDPNESLLDFFRKQVAKLFTDLPSVEAEKKRETLLHIAEFWGAYVGSPVSRQSLKYFWLEECIEGENPFVAETYHKILAHVAKAALEGADIRFESKVNAITCRGEGGGDRPSISVQGSETEEFDEVVVTAPLGWLKRNKDAFKPGLAPEVEKAIDSLGYGSLDKVYINFPTAFWEQAAASSPTSSPKPQQSTSIDPKMTTPNVTATSHPLHQSPSTRTTHYPGFTHWLSPTYAPSNPQNWDFEAMNLAALPPPSAKPTLLFYIYGPCATHIGEIIATTPPSNLDSTLLSFFHPYYSRLPGFEEGKADCVPEGVFATNWVSDEFAGYGSYTNFQVGLEDGDRCVEGLRRGMPEQGIWFAGEHTAPFVALGTSTGAWWSGAGVAGRIVEAAAVVAEGGQRNGNGEVKEG